MALTELEHHLIESLQRSQADQTEIISDLQTHVVKLSEYVRELSNAYENLYRLYSGTEKDL